jgi:ligand-binding sensor domain-containing protein
MIIYLLFSAGLFPFLLLTVSGQQYSFHEYGVRDGLPQSQAFILYQDSRGFLWISTRNGLSRFDGVEFENYHVKDGLPSNMVIKAFEDNEKNLWVLTVEGLSRYTGNRFVFYQPGSEFLNDFFLPFAGKINEKGLFFFLAATGWGGPSRILSFDGVNYTDYSSLFPVLDSMNLLNLFYDNEYKELIMLDKYQNLWSWKDSVLKKLTNHRVIGMDNDRDRIIINTENGKFEYSNGRIIPFSAANEQGSLKIEISRSGRKYTAKYYNGSETSVIDLPFSAVSYFIDRENTVWFSSESNLFRLGSVAFHSWSDEVMKLDVAWAISSDKNGNIWLGSLLSDLMVFDGTTFFLRNDYKRIYGRELNFYKGSRLLSNGQTWLSANIGVLVWDGTKFSKPDLLQGIHQVCYIYEDPDDHRIMIGTDKGVFVIKNGKTTSLGDFVDEKLGVIEGISKDDSGFYWMSGHKGLLRLYDTVSEKVEDQVLPSLFTYTVEKDSYGGIWISSEEGLFHKGKKDKSFIHGIPEAMNNSVNVVKVIDNSHILAGRATDICLIDLDKFYRGDNDYFRIYDKTDGYPGAESLDNGIIRGKEGAVWILTSENLVRFDPSMIKKNIIAPTVHFTGLYFETDSQTWEPVKMGELYYGIPEDIMLHRDQINIKITFTGISTPNPEKVRYQYMLKGTDNKWSLPYDRREIIFRNLQPGSYSFLLKAINADGVETTEPLILSFTIAKAFWETTLFTIGILLFVIVITVIVTLWMIRRKHIVNEEKQKLRSELLRLQMNSFLKEFDPHFTFNALSSVGSLIMKNDRKGAYLYLTRLSSLLRSSLRDSTSLLKPVSEELQFVSNYCELQKLRFGDRFNYSIRVENDVDMSLEIPKMTIQTFVENALKHGIENRKEGGSVDIVLSHPGEFHKIVVRDNGIGRNASKEMKTGGSGYGVKTISRIFEITGKNNQTKATLEFTDIMNEGHVSGTEVNILVPDRYSFRIDQLTVINDDELNYYH